MGEKKGLQYAPNISPGFSLMSKGMKKISQESCPFSIQLQLQVLLWQKQQDFRQPDPEASAVFTRSESVAPTLCSPLFPPRDQPTRRGWNQLQPPSSTELLRLLSTSSGSSGFVLRESSAKNTPKPRLHTRLHLRTEETSCNGDGDKLSARVTSLLPFLQ